MANVQAVRISVIDVRPFELATEGDQACRSRGRLDGCSRRWCRRMRVCELAAEGRIGIVEPIDALVVREPHFISKAVRFEMKRNQRLRFRSVLAPVQRRDERGEVAVRVARNAEVVSAATNEEADGEIR